MMSWSRFSRRDGLAGLAALLCTLAIGVEKTAAAPSVQVLQKALASVVYVKGSHCPGNMDRGGTGFVLERTNQIVTAHHVVGGCQRVDILYSSETSGRHFHDAVILKVFASGDLALLRVSAPASVVPLERAAKDIDVGSVFAGLGYQNGELSAGNLPVTLSASADTKLDGFLPIEAQRELQHDGSVIDLEASVLRFNSPLEPGMSGGPIIDDDGAVVGIVAGGLKAGTVPASWAWPANWISKLLVSNDSVDAPVQIGNTFYSLPDLNSLQVAVQSNQAMRCGGLTFSYRGRRSFEELAIGADDQQRLHMITSASLSSDLYSMLFDIWVDISSGATAVMPAGYRIDHEGDICVAHSPAGPFHQLLWGQPADLDQLQQSSEDFESQVVIPRVPNYAMGRVDYSLSKIPVDQFGRPTMNWAPPVTRSDGLIFTRKAFIFPKAPYAGQGANAFETLASRNGSFMGTVTLDEDVPTNLMSCWQTNFQFGGCETALAHFREWTRFVLATQLSTYPVY